MGESDSNALRRTPLYALHHELGGKLVPFAGYEMPVHYRPGILAEHRHTRTAAGLFDVSHMGQIRLIGAGADAALERLVPGEIKALKPGRMRYTLFTNDQGGVSDDLMVLRRADDLFLIVNAACKEQDFAHLQCHLGAGVAAEFLEDRALLALQGPAAAAVLARHAQGVESLRFLGGAVMTVAGIETLVTRSGYTGEDGFEISLAADRAEALARRLLAEPEVDAVGLGARDSLRLEAGLCLYGHDLDPETTPVEAGLNWVLGKRRLAEGGFPGVAVIRRQLADGPARLRVGLLPDGRAPVRDASPIEDANGRVLGQVTSGGFSTTLNRPIAMGYVAAAVAAPGTPVEFLVREKRLPGRVVALPFVPHRYART